MFLIAVFNNCDVSEVYDGNLLTTGKIASQLKYQHPGYKIHAGFIQLLKQNSAIS